MDFENSSFYIPYRKALAVIALAALISSQIPRFVGAASSLSLDDCYELSLKQSESLKVTEEDIAIAEARYKQSLGGILPNLKFNVTDLIQDVDRNQSSSGSSGSTYLRRETADSKFVLKQPLFKGLKEFSAMSGYKHQIKSFQLQYRRAEANLYRDVAQVFYQVARLETGLKNIDILTSLTQDRVDELKSREKLGKSRESESLSAQAQVASLKSLKAQTSGNLTAARELLSFFTGQDMSQTPLQYSFKTEDNIIPLDKAIEKGNNRFDLKAQQEEVQASRYAVRYARGDYWPILDLTGNYFTKRHGSLSDVDWDLLFNLDVPLFQGGAVKGRVREALSNYTKAKLSAEQLARQIRSNIKSAYAQLSAFIEQAKNLEEAYQKAKKSYQLQVKEYRFGLVNNLEVLQAMNNMQQLKQDFENSILDTKLGLINLDVAMDDLGNWSRK